MLTLLDVRLLPSFTAVPYYSSISHCNYFGLILHKHPQYNGWVDGSYKFNVRSAYIFFTCTAKLVYLYAEMLIHRNENALDRYRQGLVSYLFTCDSDCLV